MTRRLLDEHGASVRFSIYRFDQFRLQRLCQSTSDPKVLADAFHRLGGPVRASQDVDIPLPAGLAIRNRERKAQAEGNLPQPWSLAGALAALKDSAAAAEKAMAARALVIFSTGAEGTSLTPEDLTGQAVAAGVPIYPVALPGFPWVLPYEGYTYRSPVKGGFYYFYIGLKDDGDGVNQLSMLGPGGVSLGQGRQGGLPYFGSYYNYPFELLGDLTGGLRFDAMNHAVLGRVKRPVLGVQLLGSHGHVEPVLVGLEADCVVAAIGIHHALSEGSAVNQLGERSGVVAILFVEPHLGAHHDPHVGERGEFRVRAGRVAVVLGLVDRTRWGFGLRRGGWGRGVLREQGAGKQHDCGQRGQDMRRFSFPVECANGHASNHASNHAREYASSVASSHESGFSVGIKVCEATSADVSIQVRRQFSANAESKLIFPCYSRNFPAVTFSLHRDELSLC